MDENKGRAAATSELSAGLCVGDKVRTTQAIWDDGADHHPPGYLAQAGEVLIVRSVSDAPWIGVSHEHITDNAFCLHPGEWERVPHNDTCSDPPSTSAEPAR
jgi:hypothetical protein